MTVGRSRIWIAACVLAAAFAPAWAQFGKNKISYSDHKWNVYESPHFNVHYYDSVEPFLEEVVSYAETAYLKISKDLDHELRFRVPLVIYKTHGEFLQTNIILSELPEAVGAFAEPVQYRMVLPIDEPPDKLYKLIAHELVHIFQYSMFYEGYLGRALRSRPPTWLIEGMASYVAQDEDHLDQMAIRDAVVNNILPPIQALGQLSYLTYRYGHAVFDYIEQEHGKEGIRSFLFEFKKVLLTNNLSKAIKEAFGYDIDEFNRRFNRYLRQKYFPVLMEKKSPDEYGAEIGLKSSWATFSPTLSPSGELIGALAAPDLELDLVVLSAQDGSKVKNLTKGWTNTYKNLSTQAFAGRRDLTWSPAEDRVAVFGRKENQWPLLVFDALSGKLLEMITFDEIFECASPNFSPDGRRVTFEGNQNGVVDIFEYDMDTRIVRNLTQDEFFDANPWYAADGQTLLYNRRIGEQWKIFSVDLEDPSKKTQLTFGVYSDIQPSYSPDGSRIYFSSDRGEYGVFNIHALDLSTGDLMQYTDVVGGAFAPVEMAERDGERNMVFMAYFEGTFRLYRMPLEEPELTITAEDRLGEPAEAEPFEPDLQLTVDEDKKHPYKLKWDLEMPDVAIGVTDDGTFLGNVGLQFSDLLGDQRIYVSAASVADIASYNATYMNIKKRYNWGGSFYDFRDYFVDRSTGRRVREEYRQTGLTALISYPISRSYRVEASGGLMEQEINQAIGIDPITGSLQYVPFKDRFVTVSAGIVGDTTRFQSFGPFQGKRFSLRMQEGIPISGDLGLGWSEPRLDWRSYKQLTRRSLIAWRVFSVYNFGDWEPSYGFGGLNQLRGWEFRDFIGSRIASTNLEFRFPLVDEMRFPIFPLRNIRGFFFLDVGAAWNYNWWYDPEQVVVLQNADGSESSFIRAATRVDPQSGDPVRFEFWDSENGRMQDARATYGFGFQFMFIGGLQFNWVWSQRLPYSQYALFVGADGTQEFILQEADTGGVRQSFYITYDF